MLSIVSKRLSERYYQLCEQEIIVPAVCLRYAYHFMPEVEGVALSRLSAGAYRMAEELIGNAVSVGTLKTEGTLENFSVSGHWQVYDQDVRDAFRRLQRFREQFDRHDGLLSVVGLCEEFQLTLTIDSRIETKANGVVVPLQTFEL